MEDKQFICVESLYPKVGISGVLGKPVKDSDQINTYREALSVGPSKSLSFVELTQVPWEARKWLRSGDIVCKHNGLPETFLDVLREKQTSMFASKRTLRWYSVDEELNGRVRQKAIETQEWAAEGRGGADQGFGQVAISDPTGRLAVIFWYDQGIRELVKGFYRVFPKDGNKRKAYMDSRAQRYYGKGVHQATYELICRFIHRAFFDIGSSVDGQQWWKIRRTLPKVHKMGMAFAESKMARVIFGTKRHRWRKDFWTRIGRLYLSDPDKVPNVMVKMLNRTTKASGAEFFCTVGEAERCLQFMLWDEWKDGYKPFVIDDLVPLRMRGAKRK